jgi:hypothetical protein
MIGKNFRRKGSARGKRKERKGFDAKNAKAGGGRGVGGMREEGCYKNISKAASRMQMAWRGGIYIEKHENRFADMENCRVASGASAEMIGKQMFF